MALSAKKCFLFFQINKAKTPEHLWSQSDYWVLFPSHDHVRPQALICYKSISKYESCCSSHQKQTFIEDFNRLNICSGP